MTFLTLELRSGDPYPSLWERIGIQIPASNPYRHFGTHPSLPLHPNHTGRPVKGPKYPKQAKHMFVCCLPYSGTSIHR